MKKELLITISLCVGKMYTDSYNNSKTAVMDDNLSCT